MFSLSFTSSCEWPPIPYTSQPCQNVLAAGNFASFSQFVAASSTLDFNKNPLAGKGTWCLLPTTPSTCMLPSATKDFDWVDFYWPLLLLATSLTFENHSCKLPTLVRDTFSVS